MKNFRVINRDSSVQYITAESLAQANKHVNVFYGAEVHEVEHIESSAYQYSETRVKDTDFSIIRMSDDQLKIEYESGESVTLLDNPITLALIKHIEYLECHIHTLNVRLTNTPRMLRATIPQPKTPELIVKLNALAGYVENGSNTTITLHQDDATRSWDCVVGKKHYDGCSLQEAIDNAYKNCPPEY